MFIQRLQTKQNVTEFNGDEITEILAWPVRPSSDCAQSKI